jgi:hypothetical protein
MVMADDYLNSDNNVKSEPTIWKTAESTKNWQVYTVKKNTARKKKTH